MRVFALIVSAALLFAGPSAAEVVAYIGSGGVGSTTYVSSANPLPVNCIVGCSGGGGGGAVTIADGADITQGALADAACATDNGSCTVAALIKRNNQRLTTLLAGLPVTQSGTWTVQPGNTANTTAWKVDGSAVTQPISGTVTVTDGAGALNVIVDSSALPSGAATSANQSTQITAEQTTATGTGAPADAAWTSGSGSIIAVLKGIAGNTSSPTGVAQNSTTSGQLGSLTQCAVTTANPSYTTAKTNPCSLTTFGGLRSQFLDVNGVAPDVTTTTPTAQVGPYPSTNAAGVATAATPITCSSGNVANGTVACTLAGVSSKTTYLQGWMMSSDGATVTLGVGCTITGTQSGTMNFAYVYEAASIPSAPLIGPAGIAIPASATNTAIVLSCPASGAGGAHASMAAWGYQL